MPTGCSTQPTFTVNVRKSRMSVQPISIVVRLSDVKIQRAQLEHALGVTLDRYERIPGGPTADAQIDIPEANDYWSSALDCIQMMASGLSQLRADSSIGATCLDAGIAFRDDRMSASSVIPSSLAALAGSLGMDIELSIYRTLSR
jgi:hypothetical protein